jgi:hypothetical protein
MCRYGTRPAFAQERLAWTADGQIAYRLKRPWPDGRTELVLPPVAFLRRLCGIIPPPRRHLVRYAGGFGPASKRRAQLRALVPAPTGEPPRGSATPRGSARAGRVPWAELLRRVFATDVLSCPCGGRRSVVAVVVDAAMARAVLAALKLPCTPATFSPARAPPQVKLWFDDPSWPAQSPTAAAQGRGCTDLAHPYTRLHRKHPAELAGPPVPLGHLTASGRERPNPVVSPGRSRLAIDSRSAWSDRSRRHGMYTLGTHVASAGHAA